MCASSERRRQISGLRGGGSVSAMMRAAGTRARDMRLLVSRALPWEKEFGVDVGFRCGGFLEQTLPLCSCAAAK